MDKNNLPQKSAIDYLNEIIELSKAFSNAGQEAEFNAIQDIINKFITIESAPEPIAKCGNCVYWNSRNTPIGLCIASKNGRSKVMFSGCGLHTRYDFYCKIHQPKPPKNEKPSTAIDNNVV